MRRYIPAIVITILLLILICGSACISQLSSDQVPQQNETPRQNVTRVVDAGFAPVPVSVSSPFTSLEEARQMLEDYHPDSLNVSADITSIYYIYAIDVDGSGNATTWLFGVHQYNEPRLLIFSRNGWTTMPWNATVPSEEIAIGQVVPPGTLFNKNKAVILKNPHATIPDRRDLELKGRIYTLTINAGSTTRILTFNATTGALIA